jgi:hypothetical protein
VVIHEIAICAVHFADRDIRLRGGATAPEAQCPHVKNGYAGPVAYSHSSTVKSVEEVFGPYFVRGAADPATNDLADSFVSGFFP